MCHYTRADIAFEHIVPDGQLRMNPYSLMRDPFENKRPLFLSVSGFGEDREQHERMYWALQEEVSQSRDRFCLLALTEGVPETGRPRPADVFHCPWARARMWEHYSENHAGACLVFNREQLLTTLRENLAKKGSFWEGPVEYTTAGFGEAAGARILFDQFNDDSLSEDVRRHVMEHYRDFFFLKTADWATEYEYRFVLEPTEEEPLPEPPIHHVNYGQALSWVVVGEKFPDWQLPAAREVAKRAGAELRRMSWEVNFPWPGKAKARK
jgi:hypothetical protein